MSPPSVTSTGLHFEWSEKPVIFRRNDKFQSKWQIFAELHGSLGFLNRQSKDDFGGTVGRVLRRPTGFRSPQARFYASQTFQHAGARCPVRKDFFETRNHVL